MKHFPFSYLSNQMHFIKGAGTPENKCHDTSFEAITPGTNESQLSTPGRSVIKDSFIKMELETASCSKEVAP